MKKSLFLLPLLAGLALCGCGDDKDKGGNGGGGGGEETPTTTGELVSTIKMEKCTDMGDPGVFEKSGCKVVVEQNTCKQTIADAVKNSQEHEFRVYAYMKMNFSYTSNFKELKITYSTYVKDGKGNFFDYEGDDLQGATNTHDDSAGVAVVKLDSPSTTWSVVCWHQTRIVDVSFYK